MSKGFEYYERKEVTKCWGEPQNSDCRERQAGGKQRGWHKSYLTVKAAISRERLWPAAYPRLLARRMLPWGSRHDPATWLLCPRVFWCQANEFPVLPYLSDCVPQFPLLNKEPPSYLQSGWALFSRNLETEFSCLKYSWNNKPGEERKGRRERTWHLLSNLYVVQVHLYTHFLT